LTSDYLKEFAAIKADDDVVAADETLLNYVQDYLLLNFVLDSEDFKNKIYFKFNFKNLKIKKKQLNYYKSKMLLAGIHDGYIELLYMLHCFNLCFNCIEI
jgi:hypothetical protein